MRCKSNVLRSILADKSAILVQPHPNVRPMAYANNFLNFLS
jgi:hypothetical protein